MLVLTRKKNETIVIDGQIKIEVLKIKGNTIRLGISAPADVKVLRGELVPFANASATNVESTRISQEDFSQQPELDLLDAAAAHLNQVAAGCDAEAVELEMKSQPGRTLHEFMIDSEDLSRLPNPFVVAQAV